LSNFFRFSIQTEKRKHPSLYDKNKYQACLAKN